MRTVGGPIWVRLSRVRLVTVEKIIAQPEGSKAVTFTPEFAMGIRIHITGLTATCVGVNGPVTIRPYSQPAWRSARRLVPGQGIDREGAP